ncbi:MAG: DNA methylase [Ruminococcaceae bacterium]|nr:DNA methylase [Oscillospiraceae bacterium]
MEVEKKYLCLDLKSFYASVECVERHLDPLTTNLVVADPGRTEKTICLAVTPSLKSFGIPGRARLFEVLEQVGRVNAEKQRKAGKAKLLKNVYDIREFEKNPYVALDFVIAPPRMAHYMKWSTFIYQIYLKYVSPDDIHVYSIDEVFMDITGYLENAKMTAREFAQMIILDVLKTTGITATAGIGTNMYLAKIAMDISAKKMPADENGVRIAELDEMSYREKLWSHTPLTDFWRVGRGIARKLESYGMHTMGDVARCSLECEDWLYQLFGVNAELLIDHAWGWEPCTIADVKAYKPTSTSLSTGQVLHCPYTFEKARLIAREMIDQLAFDLVDKKLATDQLVLTVGYDIENLRNKEIMSVYKGEICVDHYGRRVPKHAHGTTNLPNKTMSSTALTNALVDLFDRIVDRNLLVRRLTIAACKLVNEAEMSKGFGGEQLDLFTDYDAMSNSQELSREKKMQDAVVNIKHKFGKNAIFKGMNLQEGATAIARNGQIGGHKA